MPKIPQYGPASTAILYGVGMTETGPQWDDLWPSPTDDPIPAPAITPDNSTHRENAMRVSMWYAACVAMPKEHDRINAEKPCKLSEAIAALEWVRENMPKLPAITDRQLTAMWFSGSISPP